MAKIKQPSNPPDPPVPLTITKFIQIAVGSYDGYKGRSHVVYGLDSDGKVWRKSKTGWELYS